MTSELFFVSLLVLLLVLMVLMVLCWIVRHRTNGSFTELRISAERPARTLTIRTKPDQALQLLDRLLERVFLQVEPGPLSEEELGEQAEPVEEPGEEPRSDSDSEDPETPTSSIPSRAAVNALQDKLWRWITVTVPPAATPAPPPSSPVNQDQTDDLCPQQSDASQHAPLSSQGASWSAFWEEEQYNESQL